MRKVLYTSGNFEVPFGGKNYTYRVVMFYGIYEEMAAKYGRLIVGIEQLRGNEWLRTGASWFATNFQGEGYLLPETLWIDFGQKWYVTVPYEIRCELQKAIIKYQKFE